MLIGYKLNRTIVGTLFFLWAFSALAIKDDLVVYSSLPQIKHISLSPSGEKIAMQQMVEGRKYLVVMSLVDGSAIASANIDGLILKRLEFINEDQILLINTVYANSMVWVGKQEFDDALIYDLNRKTIETAFHRGRQNQRGDGVSPFTIDINNFVGINKKDNTILMTALLSNDDRGNFNAIFSRSLEKKYKERLFEKGKKIP